MSALPIEHVEPSPPSPAAPPAGSREGRGGPTLSMRWIVMTVAAILSASAAFGVGFISERNARQVLLGEIETRLMLEARNLSAGSAAALLTELPELTVQPLVKAIVAQQPELADAIVVDAAGRIVGHRDTRRVGTGFEPAADLRRVDSASPLSPGESLRENGTQLVAESPVLTPDGRPLGTALVALNRSYVEHRLARARRQQAVVLVVSLVLSVAFSFVLMSRLLQPLSALRTGLRRIGQGDLETPIRLRDRTELGALAHSVNDMARDLKRAQGLMLAQGRLEHEFDIARQIQRSLLPAVARRIGNVYVCGDQKSATEVGGDYYDILTLPDGRVAIAIADVAGKGLGGCLVMAMLSAVLRALRSAESSPSELLSRIDAQFAESLQPGMFVTMFYGILDPRSGCMVWASAGHNPMLVYRAATGAVERSESRGIPIGALRGGLIRRTLGDQTLQLEPGDVMVHCTDGYTEAMAPNTRELFGLDRLADIVARHGARGPQGVIAALIDGVRAWSGDGALSDDETLLVAGWEPDHVSGTVAGGVDGGSATELEMLEVARRRGVGVELIASPGCAAAVNGWFRSLAGFEQLSDDELHLLGTGLTEVCTNIAEHGYGHDPSKRFQLWWVPPEDHSPTVRPAVRAAGRYAESGHFVVRDDGRPFRPDKWQATDFGDRQARTRGRGFGLDIIFRVMRRADYYPDTPAGNITVLAFGPGHASLSDGDPS
jgi:serine phosphatase RsbU (regulator of sigma subunit)